MSEDLTPVKWGDILPLLPKQWQKIGKPFPIPGGALILVSYTAKGIGNLYTVMMYAAPVTKNDKGQLFEYKPYGENDTKKAVAFNSRDGRRNVANFAAWEIENSKGYSAGEPDRYHEDGDE